MTFFGRIRVRPDPDLEHILSHHHMVFLFFCRTVMGAKGSKVQTVTRDFDVQIKVPDKAMENGEPPAAPRPDRSSNPDIIRITGTV